MKYRKEILVNGRYCSAFDSIDHDGTIIQIDSPTQRQKNQIAKIISNLGLPLNFEVFQGRVNNAIALFQDNTNYIILNKDFLNNIDNRTNDYWLSTYIVAHELGHLLSFHLISAQKNDSISRQQELQADHFAGAVLGRMGCPIEKARLIFHGSFLQSAKGSKTHPPSIDRLNAIDKGWENNLNSVFTQASPPTPIYIDEIDMANPNYTFDSQDLSWGSGFLGSYNEETNFGETVSSQGYMIDEGEGIIISLEPLSSIFDFDKYMEDFNESTDGYTKEEKKEWDKIIADNKINAENIRHLHSSAKIKITKWIKNSHLTPTVSVLNVDFDIEPASLPTYTLLFARHQKKYDIYCRHFVVGQPIRFKILSSPFMEGESTKTFYEIKFLKNYQ